VKKAKKQTLEIRQRKLAFDRTFKFFREAMTNLSGVAAVKLGNGCGVSKNPAAPTVRDGILDIQLVIRKCISNPALLVRFVKVYCEPHGYEEIQLERLADLIVGPQRHNLELGIGKLLIAREIFPLSKYFHCERTAPASHAGTVQPPFVRVESFQDAGTKTIAARYQELRRKQLTSAVEPEPEVEPEIQESGDQSEVEPQELDLFESETQTLQEGLLDSIELAELDMLDPFQQTGLDYHEIESCG
jgi:hypothetical protein